MPLDVWFPLAAVFVVGAMVGSFLNVCIYRLPLEKSILWPAGSRCGQCFQAIRWHDNIPLVSYWLLRGRCRTCRAKFSMRYFGVELLTALSFAGLYYLEVIRNLHDLPSGEERFESGRLAIFGYHAVLLCFLIVATFCDFDRYTIPLSLTITGTVMGLIGSIIFPWPWPFTPAEAKQYMPAEGLVPWYYRSGQGLVGGVYPWPVCWPLPRWLGDGGNWQTGLVTGLAGMLAGTMVLRAIRFLFGFGRGAEFMEPEDPAAAEKPRTLVGRCWSWFGRVGGRALGLGDADLMMMAGSFLGWQLIIVAFFVGVFPGLLLGLIQLVRRGNQPFPFGPPLALGVVLTWLGWRWLGPYFQPLFFDSTLMAVMVAACAVFMVLAGYVLRLMRLARS
jgi:leader peptidase (prepilin peptidase)/N-methyltransferase